MTLYQGYRVETTRLRGWDYRDPGWYFVTICTQKHACLLGAISGLDVTLTPIGLTASSQLKALSDHYSNVVVDCSVVMPNHIHAIIVIEGMHAYSPSESVPVVHRTSPFPACAPRACSLASIVRSYKAGLTRWCRDNAYDWFAWQSGFYDRVLRSNASVNAIRDYIHRNPANWLFDRDHPRNLATAAET